MQAVEMLSSYISRGVYTVSGPFHPFGGAVDVIVVEQQDGSFKSSPWYVRFGKFQGVLKTREKVVKIFVNGEEAKFHMYLDHKGEAYFLKESESDEGEYFLSPPTSGDETDGDMKNTLFKKSQSCDFESKQSKSVSQFEIKNRAVVARTNSRRSRFFGLVFGRNSVKEDINHGNMLRLNSLERAEIAADLLETRWSTNLKTKSQRTKSFPKGHFEGGHNDLAPVDSRQIVENGKDPVSLDGNNENKLGNESANMEHLDEKSVDAASSLATRKEVIKVYRSNTDEIVDRQEVFVNLSDAKSDEFETTSGDSVFKKPVAEIQSPAFPIVSNGTEDILDDMGKDSVGTNSVDLGKDKEVSSYFYYETYERSTVRFDVSDDEILQSQNKYRDENIQDKHNTETVVETAQFFSENNSEAVHDLTTNQDKSTETKVCCSEHSQGESSTFTEHDCDIEDACKLNTVTTHRFGAEDTGAETISSSEDTIRVTTVDMLKIEHFNQNKKDATQCNGGNASINLDVMGNADTHQFSPSTGAEPCCIHVGCNHAQDQIQVRNVTEAVVSDKLILRNETTVSGNTANHLSSTEKTCNSYSLPKNIEQNEFLFGEDGQEDGELFPPTITDKVDQPEESLMFDPEESDAEGHEVNVYNDEPSKSLRRASTCQSIPIDIPANKAHLDSTDRLIQSLPNFRPHTHDLESSDVFHRLSHSLHSNSAKVQSDKHMEEFAACSAITADQVALTSDSSIANVGKDTERVGSTSDLKVELSLCKHLLFEGMGAEAAARAFDSEKVDREKFAALGSSVIKNKRLIVRINDRYFPHDAAAPILLGMISFGDGLTNLEGMISVDQVEKCHNEDSSKAIVPSGGSWKLWPFSFKKSRTITEVHLRKNETKQKDAEITLEGGTFSDVGSMPRRSGIKKRVQSITPSSEQLASLDLKEGRNLVTFSFETAMLGRQQVDARIYLWKWDTRIVVSDVDGTITKSDVLGQVMPLVGKDWSQTGVTHLFSSIKDNGYQFIFLSARAISQAHLTRQFLFNLKQDGKALPDGPVVISPDGLFPSLYREVIRRAPHEFKISCLEDIRALFPQECNPFYAGFGNRHTDEISYLKVGIPKGKIFTINPKGEVAVNRRVDTKSYTSLHALVNGMFPATHSVEQEDFNSWNYWRLPLPDIEDS